MQLARSTDIQSILEIKAIKNYCRHRNTATQKGTCRGLGRLPFSHSGCSILFAELTRTHVLNCDYLDSVGQILRSLFISKTLLECDSLNTSHCKITIAHFPMFIT